MTTLNNIPINKINTYLSLASNQSIMGLYNRFSTLFVEIRSSDLKHNVQTPGYPFNDSNTIFE